MHVQHFYDGVAAAALAALFPVRWFEFYNGSGSDIAAGVPVDLDLSVTTDAASRPIGPCMAIKAAAVGTRAIGGAMHAIPNGTWGRVQVAGPQTGVAVDATVAAGDELGVGTAGKLDVSGRRKVRGILSAAQVIALNATPITVIAAPGAGKYIRLIRVHWFLDFASAAYDAAAAGDTLGLKYTDGTGAQLADVIAGNAIGAAAADYHADAAGIEVVPVANAPVVAHIDGGSWFVAAGDSPLRYEIEYEIVDLDLSTNTPIAATPFLVATARAITAASGGTATVLWYNPLGIGQH